MCVYVCVCVSVFDITYDFDFLLFFNAALLLVTLVNPNKLTVTLCVPKTNALTGFDFIS